MFAAHLTAYGHSHVSAERQHEGCPCVTATIETAAGDKMALSVDDAAALETLGWALLGEAGRLRRDGQAVEQKPSLGVVGV